jgi:hypothetical protein
VKAVYVQILNRSNDFSARQMAGLLEANFDWALLEDDLTFFQKAETSRFDG